MFFQFGWRYFWQDLKFDMRIFFNSIFNRLTKFYRQRICRDSITCLRRVAELGPWSKEENLDFWTLDDTCSFCGSIKPAVFFEAVKRNVPVIPTDKNYKAYINIKGKQCKVYFQHFSQEDKEMFVGYYNLKVMKLDTPGSFYTMPFFLRYKNQKTVSS